MYSTYSDAFPVRSSSRCANRIRCIYGNCLNPARPSTRQRLAKNLRLLRTLCGWSQEAGPDQSCVGAIEHGERNLSLDTVEKLTVALELELIDLLLRRTDPDERPRDLRQVRQSP
ncbi:MAG: helix-turn-helix transcriptional regulator [Gammaproteobacteria bacterium]|jgi:hypothetical protein